jgi:hypothetical protein
MKTWQPTDPDEPGVYLIELDDVIRYVGQTHSMRQRMGSHAVFTSPLNPPPRRYKSLWYTFCNVYFVPEVDQLKRFQLESSLIREHNPSLNIRSRIVSAHFKKFIEIIGSQAEAAKLLNVSPTLISLMASGKRTIRPAMAERIEIATQGKVTKESLVFGGRRADQD